MAEGLSLEFAYRGRRYASAEKGLQVLAREFAVAESRVAAVLADQLSRYLEAVRESLRRRHSTPFAHPANAPATGSESLLRRTGQGIDGVRVQITKAGTLAGLRGVLAVPFPLAVHEDGATISPRTAKYLAIPMPAALDSRGVPLRPRPRDWDRTFVHRSRAGNLLIFRRDGGRIVPLYLLKREVRLPPRLKAMATLDAGADYFVDTAIDAAARSILAGP